ncbi:N-acetyltransferase family protein [Pseudaestuariivita sp.]|uniref:N-acetyltransferase family protein n=1 Tax=Pseudaestuariivita sp. TaxID=2211669 RepID=UPI00405A363E
MAVTLRRATREDAEAMAEIWNPIIRDTTITFTTEEKTLRALRADIYLRQERRQPWMVAETDRIIGFGGFAPFRGGPGYLRTVEHTIYLAPEAQGAGVGAKLLKDIELSARAGGASVLIGGVSGENAPAIAFHRRHGFDTEVVLPKVGVKFGRSLDLHLFHKFLS